MKQKLAIILSILIFIPLMSVPAYAHVIVTPNQIGVAAETIFSVSVPNEKDVAVTQVKLLIPGGVTDVTPTAKEGWTILTTFDGDHNISSVTWSGTIPVGERQDFSFSAQAPGQTTELDWKAYQTYADGSIVHWDQKPAGSDDATGDSGPYSVTKVINDLTAPKAGGIHVDWAMTGAYGIAGLALLVAVGSLFTRRH